MTTPPPESSPPLLAPTLEETRALNNAFSDEEIRALAQMILKSGELGFTPSTILKGIVVEVQKLGSPPTITVQVSGDTSVNIPGVKFMSNYTPVVGHTVLIEKQGPDIVVVGHVSDAAAVGVASGAGDWTVASLAAGSHNGNSLGQVAYRRVMDNGSWKMQWRGGWNVSGTTVVSSLPTDFRPSNRKSLLTARNASGAISVRVDFNTDGSVVLVGATTGTTSATTSGDVGYFSGSTGSTFAGSTVTHSHNGAVASATITHGSTHSHGMSHDHAFYGGSHSHTVPAPTWVSFDGLEYFL